jgi:L-fucose isomerase-like protein
MVSKNVPVLKLFLVATSRNNFARELADSALVGVEAECRKLSLPVVASSRLVETEEDAMAVLGEAKEKGCNALAVILGNFGPEGPESILAQYFSGPVMYAAVTEDSQNKLGYDGRRDAYCGLLNCSYNLNLRGCRSYIPDNPVGSFSQIGMMIRDFIPIARAIIGLKHLKIISFGSRPREFFACNAPIQGLYTLGVEIEENSELDLLVSFKQHKGDTRIPGLVEEMKKETGNTRYGETLPALAQYELTLLDWARDHKGSREYIAFANKCWPAFQQEFGFLPCYVHSRLMNLGYPVGCETDVYGGLSEFLGLCLGNEQVTLLDINNSIPDDLYTTLKDTCPYRQEELFIGFHCGNTSSALLQSCELKYKLDRKNAFAPETGKELTRGTLEGAMKAGKACCYRLHANPDGSLSAYIARGEILPGQLATYGVYALFGIPEMNRFYRHVLVEKHFPHHSAVIYGDYAAALFSLFRYLGVPSIGYNRPAGDRYETENPFLLSDPYPSHPNSRDA